MKRLIQAGLELQFYPAAFAEMAAENIRTGVVGILSVYLACLHTNGDKGSIQRILQGKKAKEKERQSPRRIATASVNASLYFE
jgi:hypothetical protein